MFRNSSWFKVKVSILQDTSRVFNEFPRVSAGFENKQKEPIAQSYRFVSIVTMGHISTGLGLWSDL